jgi:Fe-S cluster assembly protein SufD
MSEMTVQELFSELYQKKGNSPLAKAQEMAWLKFLELGLPTKIDEAFKYVPLSELDSFNGKEISFASSMQGEGTLLFKNGKYCDEFSNKNGLPKEMIILPLTKAWKTFGNFLQNRILEGIKEEKNPFALLNSSLSEEALFIYLPPHTRCEIPLKIIHEVRSDGGTLFPRIHLFLGKHAQLELYCSDLSESRFLQSGYLDITLEENSTLKLSSMVSCSNESYVFNGLRATLKRDADFQMIYITDGGKSVRVDGEVKLLGEGSRATLKGISHVEEHRSSHLYLQMEHHAPNTYSLQKFKNILNDFSRTSFEGKIFVKDVAQKTQAYQMNPNLVLSDRALAVSRPNLEIFADDVKASHGATCGEIDREHLFYLKTRGMDEQTAKRVLIYGFCREILEEITLPSFYEEALSLVTP